MRQRTQTEANPDWSRARDELRRAYLLVQFGNVDEAIEICREVDDAVAGEHHLPATLEGAFLVAKGELQRALRRLREVVDRFPDEPLPRLHFAEACFVDGRDDQGRRALRAARECDDGAHDEFLEALESTWSEASDAEIPPPVRIRETE